MAILYNKKVQPRKFRKGDVALKEILPLLGESHIKWASNYKGPYIAKRAFSSGTLILTWMNEKILLGL